MPKSRKPITIKGNLLKPSTRLRDWYAAELKKLTRQMTAETTRAVEMLYGAEQNQVTFATDANLTLQLTVLLNRLSRKYQQLFEEKGAELVRIMVRRNDKSAEIQLKASIKAMLGQTLMGSIVSPELAETIEASVVANVDLIKSIPTKYYGDVTGAIMRSIQDGGSLKSLAKTLDQYSERTGRHVELMAQDQTRKTYQAITRRKMQAGGIKQFEWVHTGGARDPRPYHKYVLNGQIFDLNDRPVINPKTGETGYPGDDYNCHCIMRPVIVLGQGTAYDQASRPKRVLAYRKQSHQQSGNIPVFGT